MRPRNAVVRKCAFLGLQSNTQAPSPRTLSVIMFKEGRRGEYHAKPPPVQPQQILCQTVYYLVRYYWFDDTGIMLHT